VSAETPVASRVPHLEFAGRVTFPRVVRSEWTKFRSVRSTAWSLAIGIFLTIAFPVLFAFVTSSHWGTMSAHDRAHRSPLDIALAGVNVAQLAIVNVYLKRKLGVEIAEQIKKDATLASTKVILIGALFRANRFRAYPTNLYGADEYIEEQIPEKEFRQIIQHLFPDSKTQATPAEPREYEDARRLARLILSDIVIYHPEKVEQAIRDNTFFEVLHEQINEGREYYDSRVPLRVRRDTEIFAETMQQFVQMKREELTK